jgi:hypothetical protein
MGDMLSMPKGALVNFVVRNVKSLVPDFELPGAIKFNQALGLGERVTFVKPVVTSDDIAVLQYTGGTTGVSKGAVLLHRNVIANLLQSEAWNEPVMKRVPANEQPTSVCALPLYHIFAFTVNMMLGMRTGGKNILIPNPRDLPAVLKTLSTQTFHSFPAVNTLFNGLANHPDFDTVNWKNLKVSVGGGMAVTSAVAALWLQKTGCHEGTVNTDFAQADVDRQVVNLSRFSVFFPERRQFFLENADLLNAGGLNGRYVVQPFFSRRIGLADDGTLLPIDGGLRYAYRTGRTTAGALAMRQAAVNGQGATTFGVARGSQFFGRATRLGATVALRDGGGGRISSGSTTGMPTPASTQNLVTAFDAFTRIGEQVQLSGMISTSSTDGRTGVAATYGVARSTPMVTAGLLGALVTRDYDPQTGFVSRPNVLMTNPYATVTMQPAWLPRKVVWFKHGPNAILFQDPTTRRIQEGSFSYSGEILFRSGASITPVIEHSLQRPTAPVVLFPRVAIAAGTHDYLRVAAVLRSDQSANIAGTATVSSGAFFDGSLDRAEFTTRWSPSPYVSLRGSYEMNRLRSLGTRDSSFVTHLAGPELRVFLNPRLQWSAFYQYNTAVERGTLNARFSWEFTPLSFLYVVYNDRQAVLNGTIPTARSLIVKISWLRQL